MKFTAGCLEDVFGAREVRYRTRAQGQTSVGRCEALHEAILVWLRIKAVLAL